MNEENKEKLKSNSDKLSNFLFERIGEYIQENAISNHEMLATLMLMMITLLGSLKAPKELKLDLIDRQFSAMRHAVEATEDMRKQ